MYEIIHVNGKTLSECVERLKAILDAYLRGDFECKFLGSIVIFTEADGSISCLREVIRK